jgi:biotin carboxyl carrier protein
MKRKFKITIEGVSHEVEIEEIPGEAGSQIASPMSASPLVKPQVNNKAAERPTNPPAVVGSQAPKVTGKGVIAAPMQGMILNVKVKVGDTVKAGDILLVLEAMKMDTDIPSPKDGIVKEIFVSAGQSVKRGGALVVIEG